jgi:hypothetical protein
MSSNKKEVMKILLLALAVSWVVLMVDKGVSLDIENYCTLRSFFDLPTLAGRSRRNLPEAGIRLLFQI